MYGELGVGVLVCTGVLVGVLVGTGVKVGEGVGVGGAPTTTVVSALSGTSFCTAIKILPNSLLVSAGLMVIEAKPGQA